MKLLTNEVRRVRVHPVKVGGSLYQVDLVRCKRWKAVSDHGSEIWRVMTEVDRVGVPTYTDEIQDEM